MIIYQPFLRLPFRDKTGPFKAADPVILDYNGSASSQELIKVHKSKLSDGRCASIDSMILLSSLPSFALRAKTGPYKDRDPVILDNLMDLRRHRKPIQKQSHQGAFL